jgi:hypothetical protein
MARGDEHRSKHHQDVGSSTSGPSAKPKKLAKRPRPNSYQEESSPPRVGTPDEMECLKMYSLEVHTNREILNYSKEDPMNLITIHNRPCYSLPKERGIDERF